MKKKLKWDSIDQYSARLELAITKDGIAEAIIEPEEWDENGNCVGYYVSLNYPDSGYDECLTQTFKTIEKAKAFAEKKIEQNLLKLKKAIEKYV